MNKAITRSKTLSVVPTEKQDKKHKDKTSRLSLPQASKVDDALGALQLTLEGLESAAKLAPIPFLGDAASAALFILSTVQNTRDNRASLQQLAKDCYNMILMIYETLIAIHQKHSKVPLRLCKSIERLASNLDEIKSLTTTLSNRGLVTRYFTHKTDKSKVTDCERALRSSLDAFHLESAMSTWAEVDHISSQKHAPKRSKTAPVALFTVTDNSRGHKFVTGGGTIIQEHGLKIVGGPNSPLCMSPASTSHEPAWLRHAEAGVINASTDHEFNASGGGQIRVRHGTMIESEVEKQ